MINNIQIYLEKYRIEETSIITTDTLFSGWEAASGDTETGSLRFFEEISGHRQR